MNFLALRRLRNRLPKNNQKGFTLIELLVVISILGILAAVVTMSLVGITKVAQTRAGDTETKTVQIAMDTMLADQGVDSTTACAGAPADAPSARVLEADGTTRVGQDMNRFPSNTPWSATPTHTTVALYPHYLREAKTHGVYYCSGTLGEIIQADFNP